MDRCRLQPGCTHARQLLLNDSRPFRVFRHHRRDCIRSFALVSCARYQIGVCWKEFGGSKCNVKRLHSRKRGGLGKCCFSQSNGDEEGDKGGSTRSNREDSHDEKDASTGQAQDQYCKYGSNWQRMLVQLPLEISALVGDDDAHYLEKRQRKRWWKRAGVSFPRLPPASFSRVHAHPPPLSLWQKVLPLACIFFTASFNLTILQTLKDAILVTAAGAEVLPYLAAFGVLPASLAFFVFYGRLVETIPPRSVFYVTVLPLVLFYASFAAFIYPHHSWLHPVGLAEGALSWIPSGLVGLVKAVEYWTFSIFFCMVCIATW